MAAAMAAALSTAGKDEENIRRLLEHQGAAAAVMAALATALSTAETDDVGMRWLLEHQGAARRLWRRWLRR